MYIILIGTKAQLVKMAPVIQQLMAQRLAFRFVLTGQHAETMQDLIDSFELCPPHDCIVTPKETDTKVKIGSWLLKAVINGLRKSYINKDATVLVHGDTLSTLLGALLGRLKGATVVHVEAGLRSFNIFHPFPEELTRLAVSRLANIFFCSDEWSAGNLGGKTNVFNIRANTILDAYRFAVEKHAAISTPAPASERYCVVSIHRFENISNQQRFDFIMDRIVAVSAQIDVRFVLHPVTRKKLNASRWQAVLDANERIVLTERMTYIDFTHLLLDARLLISDGGSNQEEASIMGIPCLLMREATERQDGLGDNVVISNYDDTVIDRFLQYHLNMPWRKKELPDIRPAQAIVRTLQRIRRSGDGSSVS